MAYDGLRNEHEELEECARQGRTLRPHGPYRIRIGDAHVVISDPQPTARQLLEAAHLHPADEFILLMHRRDGMLADVNLDDTVDLLHNGPRRFLAFRSDRMFQFEIDGRRFPWGNAALPEAELRSLGEVPDNYGIWLERKGQEDMPVARGSTLDLSGVGVERFYSGAEQTTAGRGLPERDASYLVDNGILAEVLDQAGQKALLLRGYPLPSGKFDAERADILVLLPSSYPDAGPDMFYTFPWLTLRASGGYAQQANVPHPFGGVTYQRWSRHSTVPWRPGVDGIRLVLRRIDAALRDAR